MVYLGKLLTQGVKLKKKVFVSDSCVVKMARGMLHTKWCW